VIDTLKCFTVYSRCAEYCQQVDDDSGQGYLPAYYDDIPVEAYLAVSNILLMCSLILNLTYYARKRSKYYICV